MVLGTHIKDFKEQNPELIATFKDFSKVYLSYSDTVASSILWSAYFVSVIANDKNPYKNFLSDDERREKIAEQFCTIYSKKFLGLEKIFSSLVLTKEHTLYNIHLRKYEEFTASFDGLDFDKEADWKKYLDASPKLEKINKFFDELGKKYSESINKGSNKEGGGSYTAAEKRNRDRQKRDS